MDDEGFLLAIAAAPADNAPRLIYADWLDECGDVRGNYLRIIMLLADRIRRGIPWEDLKQSFEIAQAEAPVEWQYQVGPWFTVTLDSVQPEQKIHTIKAIRACTFRGLSEAKVVLDEALKRGSSVVAEHLTLAEAEQLRKNLEIEPWPGGTGKPPCRTSLHLDNSG